MSLVDPRYEAGEKVGKYIFYSHIDFNGLFRLDIEKLENVFICHFDDDYCVKKKHNKSLRLGKNIIFLPSYGNYIDVFNYETYEMKRIKLNRYKSLGAITGSFVCFDNILYVCPFFLSPKGLELPFYQISLDTFEALERWDINDKVRTECKHKGELCLWYGNSYGSEIYSVIFRSNKVIKIDLKNGFVKSEEAPINNLYGIGVYNNNHFLVTYNGSLFSMNSNKYLFENVNEDEKTIRYVERYKNKLYLIPEFGDSLIELSFDGEKFMEQGEYKLCVSSEKHERTFSWHRLEDGFLYLFSDMYSTLTIVDMDSEKVNVFELKGKTIWERPQEERSFMKKILHSRYEENEKYTLTEFCRDIIKI